MKTGELVGKFVIIHCDCGECLINLMDSEWNKPNIMSFTCDKCNTPLVFKDEDGSFYLIGKKIT